MGVCSKKKKREMGVWFWVIDDEMQNDDDLKLNIMAAEYIYMIRMVCQTIELRVISTIREQQHMQFNA